MRTVLKFPLEVTLEQVLFLPVHFKILRLALQRNAVCVWIEMEEDAKRMATTVYLCGTGHRVPREASIHIGSVEDAGGFIWHYYMARQG